MSDLTAALADPEHHWTPDEIAELIATAVRWGYEARDEEDRGYWAGYRARIAEENASYPPPKVFTCGRWFDQAAERQRADAEVRALVELERAA